MFTYQKYLDDECTWEEYLSTLNCIKLELGKVYKQMSDTWAVMHYKIIFQDENISVGVCVMNGISDRFKGDYEMFNTKNGLKYQDKRTCYRLIEEIK